MNLDFNCTTNQTNVLTINATCGTKDLVAIGNKPQIGILVSIILSCGTAVVNLLAAAVLFKQKVKLYNARNMHLLSLSIADLCVGISKIILSADYFYIHDQTETLGTCFARVFIFGLCYMNSITHILVICFGMACAVQRKKEIIRTRAHIVLTIILTFMGSLTICLPTILFKRDIDPHAIATTCDLDTLFHVGFFLYFGWASLILELAIIVIMLSLLFYLYQHFRKNQKLRLTSFPFEIKKTMWKKNELIYKREQRALATIGIIFVIFVALTTPFHVCFILEGLEVHFHNVRLIRSIVSSIAVLNSAINPFVYMFRIPEMKLQKCCGTRVHTESSNNARGIALVFS